MKISVAGEDRTIDLGPAVAAEAARLRANDGIGTLAASQNSLQNAYLANLIGKQVGYEGTSGGTATTLYGTVTGVSYESDGTYFFVDGATKVAVGDVTVIK